ncbi:glycerol kinase GlpK [Dyadobacter chenwenxiniae]|uniref:ATP:glycerol 3-phosphotransferase n=1 Tax=Dyadobacter chenwenxiniae TaxID=2906456 RepID=A0A9X1TG63_9BACT|nr:glycerol kinase GlpK [Dyadobacter chenwenxiniae]MCF0063354.1 glycerol kinase GlpK [Dyadobacter chenwenxiniae]UON85267.1 glycerol kinase GlpK [Dyadobacter chenwenxiniae]
MNGPFILAIDQGTSSTKTVLFDINGMAVARGVEPLHTSYLDGGFVEQDPEAIYNNVLGSVEKCLADLRAKGGIVSEIKACGISNQRETFVLWDEKGNSLCPAVVWQCKRSVAICERLKASGLESEIRQKTGLLVDPYFSASKVIWLNENHAEVKSAIQAGKAFFGTVDTWLLYKLTDGAYYRTDHTNASRTMFFNLHTLDWDRKLLAEFDLHNLQLPDIQPSSSSFGATDFGGLLETKIEVSAMIGDSHAAAFGEGCFAPGIAKATLGTGSSILMNIGKFPKPSQNGMVTTIGWSMGKHVEYALEGVIVTCGATISWLKNNLGMFGEITDTQEMANAVRDNNGVYLVPAFSGLGAPHWDMSRKASITGLTFDCNKNHIVRAALESIPYQIKDVIMAMESDTGILLQELKIDGGLTANTFVVQFLADLLEKPVVNLGFPEVSALGAAYLAGLQAGVYESIAFLKGLSRDHTTVNPSPDNSIAASGYLGWREAVG